MPISVEKIQYQIQLADSVKSQYPNSPIVLLKIQDLVNVADNLTVGQYLRVAAGNTIDSTAVAPGGGIENGADFPAAPSLNDIFLLTRQQGSNAPGIYQRAAASWTPILTPGESADLPSGTQLPAQVSGIFFLTAQHLNNPAGVYASVAGVWTKIADVYSDTQIRALITALTGRVDTLEADNPIENITIAGNTLTFTQKDGTTTDLALPAGESAGGGAVAPSAPATSDLIYGLTSGIADVRDDTESSRTAAIAAANTAYNNNNQSNAQIATQGLRTTRTANSLSTGAYVNFTAPASALHFNPWILIPTANFSIARFFATSGENEGQDDSENWSQDTAATININNIEYRMFVRNSEISNSESAGFIITAYR